ncbi:NADH dehydrogenase [Williamsia sterculiae]|uniref:NADH dehydrogenase n=1 Tax=Williamsia sterculiae TaxID=1344003 RepID=A0A1N7GYC0_9NOCA|nr:NADH dehydrogenase [Williamsia sterculiae]
MDDIEEGLDMDAHVVVIGGGYAGCMAANRLAGTVRVTVINADPRFVERIRLHQLAAGTGSATREFTEVLNSSVAVVTGAAHRVDVLARRVLLDDGSAIAYDRLVYAVGSGAGRPRIRGAEHVYGVGDLNEARRLADRLRQPAEAVVVVGGGLTGAETAAEIAESRTDLAVTLVCGGVLTPTAGDRGRRSIARRLRRLGVDVRANIGVVEVNREKVMLSDGSVLPSDVTVWTAGFGVPTLARDSGFTTDRDGRMRVDETLTSVDDSNVVAAGDAAAVSGHDLRMSCQAAMPLGAQAARTVLASLRGARPDPVDQGFSAQCVGLGRHGATVVRTNRADVPKGLWTAGRAGGVVKEQVCRYTVWMLALEARRPGSYRWPRGER